MNRIMIVDDAAFMRESIKLMLRDEGFEIVAEAVNGADAVVKYKEYRPDIVTMDITMPEMTGLEALKKIKEFDRSARVVMVSAMGQEALVRESVLSGASNFIVKPFVKPKLVEVLTSLA